jgi:AhpD family alkylhydroperoxidase
MEPRLDYSKVLPEGLRQVNALHRYAENCGLEASLMELIRLRASQINGCSYCIDMHSKDARSKGETEQRLYGLTVWREVPYYSERERVALAFTEAVTRLSEGGVSDAVYEQARGQFSEEELVKLMIVINVINVWNRFAITFGDEPGSYEPDHFVAQRAMVAEAAQG